MKHRLSRAPYPGSIITATRQVNEDMKDVNWFS